MLIFSTGSTLGDKYLNMTSYWPYAVRSSNVCAKYLQSARSGKKSKKDMLFSYGNAWSLLTFMKACGQWGPLAPALGLVQKTGHVTLFDCSWRSVWYQLCDIRVDSTNSIRRGENYRRLTWTSSYAAPVQPAPRKVDCGFFLWRRTTYSNTICNALILDGIYLNHGQTHRTWYIGRRHHAVRGG